MAMMAPATRARLEPKRVAPLLGTVVAAVVVAAVVFAGSSDFLVEVRSAVLEEAVVRVVMVAFRLTLTLLEAEVTGVVLLLPEVTELAEEEPVAEEAVVLAEAELEAEALEVAEAEVAELVRVPVPVYSNRTE